MTAEILKVEFKSIAEILRDVADDIEAGEHPAESGVLILDTKVFGMGTNRANPMGVLWDLDLARQAIFKASGGYNYGAHRDHKC